MAEKLVRSPLARDFWIQDREMRKRWLLEKGLELRDLRELRERRHE